MDGKLVRGEQHLYLQQPGYGTSYLIGKIEIETLIAERKEQIGDAFTVKRFMDGVQRRRSDPRVARPVGAHGDPAGVPRRGGGAAALIPGRNVEERAPGGAGDLHRGP